MPSHYQLIADSGSTKTDWCLLNGTQPKRFQTQGINPYFLTTEEIADIIKREAPELAEHQIEKVSFYGAGINSGHKKQEVQKALKKLFPDADMEISSDLLGAARALCQQQKGLVCILGTGSNSCYYNGKTIAKQNPSLGFILGDEGSGNYMGKKVLQHYFYNIFDEDLKLRFENRFKLTKEEVLDNVYKKSFANRYLAGFSVFLIENRGHYMVENIIEDSLIEFFHHHIFKYNESWKVPVHFMGSIALHFQDAIRDLCNHYQLECGTIIKSPMEGLVQYHK